MRTEIEQLTEQVVNGLGYELVEFETSPKSRFLRVFIDIDRGVSVDDCATVSNQLSRVFAVENIDYERLEVSSPGLDRPLRKLADFQRFSGNEVQVQLRIPIDKQRNFVGVLVGISDGTVQLRTDKGELNLPYDDIAKARLIPRY